MDISNERRKNQRIKLSTELPSVFDFYIIIQNSKIPLKMMNIHENGACFHCDKYIFDQITEESQIEIGKLNSSASIKLHFQIAWIQKIQSQFHFGVRFDQKELNLKNQLKNWLENSYANKSNLLLNNKVNILKISYLFKIHNKLNFHFKNIKAVLAQIFNFKKDDIEVQYQSMHSARSESLTSSVKSALTKPHYNSMIIRAYIKASDRQLGQIQTDQILNQIGLSRDYFNSPSNWVSVEYFEQFLNLFIQKGNEFQLQKDSGYYCVTKDTLGVNDYLLKHFVSPLLTFKALEYYLSKFNKVLKFKVIEYGHSFARIRLLQDDITLIPKHSTKVDHWISVLEAICVNLGAQSEITVIKSFYNGDPYIEFLVKWSKDRKSIIIKNISFAFLFCIFGISVLSIHGLDRIQYFLTFLIGLLFILISYLGMTILSYKEKYHNVVSAFEKLEKDVDIRYLELQESRTLIEKKNQEELRSQLLKNFAEVARRTAHDIRSPLTTINYVAKKIHQTNPEDGQSLMLMSKQLIDIANDLLNYNENQKSAHNQDNDKLNSIDFAKMAMQETNIIQNKTFKDGQQQNVQNNFEGLKKDNTKQITVIPNLPEFHSDELFQILTEIVEMKRIEHAHSDLRISVYNDLEKPGRVQFDRSQLMRIISNVINNANEAIITRPGMISISMANHFIEGADYIAIEIRDNGPGFPSEVIQRLGQAGNTSGKENGHGIGLSSAYQTIQTWGGQLSVASIKPAGAKVSLMFAPK